MLLRWILLSVMCVGCTASPVDKQSDSNKKLCVLSTTSMIGDLVKEVGGEYIQCDVLISGELDPHSYEMVKGDREKFQCADVVFSNGLLLEHSASMEHWLHCHEGVVRLGDELYKQDPSRFIVVDGHTVDPHIWMDLSLWSSCVDLIVQKLSLCDPEHASEYLTRGNALYQRLMQLDDSIVSLLSGIEQCKRYLVTSHDAFQYYVRRYFTKDDWESHVNAIQGLAPDEQICPLDIVAVVQYLRDHNVQRVFFESNLNPDGLHKVISACKGHGMQVQLAEEPLLGDTLGDMGSYFDMMEHNTRVIYDNLQ